MTLQDGHVLHNAGSTSLRCGGGKGAACLESRLLECCGMKTGSLVELKMLSESKAGLTVTDMGFGEFFPPSGLQWESEFKII